MDFHDILILGSQWANIHVVNSNLTQPHLPKMVMTYHVHIHTINTNSYKPSYHGQILMDLHKIFSIGPHWENRHELNIIFT